MAIQPCIYLHAQPDFSVFRFTAGIAGSILIELRFTGQRQGPYDLLIEERPTFHPHIPGVMSDDEMEYLLFAILQAIEMYTGKYSERTVRLRATSKVQATVFQIIMRIYEIKLLTYFTIEEEMHEPLLPFHKKKDNITYVLKRRQVPGVKDHPVLVTLNTHSRLFGHPVCVRLYEKSLREERPQPAPGRVA